MKVIEENELNILAISLFYKPIWPGFGVRVPQLILDEAARNGDNVTLFTGRIPKDIEIETKHRQKVFSDKIGKGSVTINRLWTPNVKHEGIFNRVLTYFLFMFQCFFKLLTSGILLIWYLF